MKKFLIIFLSLSLLLSTSVFLTGCNDKLKDEKDIQQEIENLIPNTKLQKVEKNSEEKSNTYYFSNGEFEFKYINYLSSNVFGFDENASNCDYYKQLLLFKKEDIEKALSKYNYTTVNLDNPNLSSEENRAQLLEYENPINFSTYSNEFPKELKISFFIDKYSEIDTAYSFLNELYEMIKPYALQEKSSSYKMDFSISFSVNNKGEKQYSNQIYRYDVPLTKADISFENNELWTEYYYKTEVKALNISDDTVNVDDLPRSTITKLYINDEQVTSEKYDIKFIYNIEDGKYYTSVCFGMEFDANGGVKDYLQREIIEKYYPDCNYKINNTLDTTTYSIGKNNYKIYWEHPNKENVYDDYMVFCKNGKDMKITNVRTIGNEVSGPSYNKFISVDDFAKIMEMEVKEITNGVIYLKKA